MFCWRQLLEEQAANAKVHCLFWNIHNLILINKNKKHYSEDDTSEML